MTVAPGFAGTRQRGTLRPGWPILAVLYGYPLWWLLGLSVFSWILFALPATAWLWSRRRVLAPPGLGWWLLFLGWVLLSSVSLSVNAFDRLPSFAFRTLMYMTAGVYLVYAYNLPRHRGNADRIVNALVFFYAFAVGAAIVAIVAPVTDFTTPFERILPRSLSGISFVRQMVHGQLAQVHTFLGYPVARPAAPFAFTNEWGSAIALLTPIVVYAAGRHRGWRRMALLSLIVLALVPAVVSLNRGLWLSFAAAALYVAARLAIRGRTRPLLNLIGAALLLIPLILLTPMGSLVAERLDSGHSDDARVDLVTQSIDGIAEAPLLGHGAPLVDPEAPDRAPIGTHGQVWLLGFSHGIPAVILFVATLLAILIRSRHGDVGSLAFWGNVTVFVALVQMAFYSLVPVQIQLIMVISGLATRAVLPEPAPRPDYAELHP